MVSSIDKKRKDKNNQSEGSSKSSSNIVAFIKSLASWVVGIVLAIVMYVSFSTAYYNYNNEIDLPTDIKNYPYAKPSLKKNITHHAKRMAKIGAHLGKKMKDSVVAKGRSKLTKMGMGKHLDTLDKHVDMLKKTSLQRGGSKDKANYFYRKKDSFMSDWIADILIYSWSSLRENIAEVLPIKKDNKSLQNASYFTKLFMFLLSPIAIKLGTIFMIFIGTMRTFWGVFAVSPSSLALLITLFFTIFPFPILAPVFGIIAMIVGILQAGWFFYFFGLKGFNASKPGTLKETGKKFANIITILLAVGLMSASGNLSDGVAKGVNIGSIILIFLSIIDMGRKAYKQRKH